MLIHDSAFDHLGTLLTAMLGGGVATRYLVLAVRALPAPLPMGSRFYLWLYTFVQSAFANPDLAAKVTNGNGGK